jgi:Lon protease-like protein
VATLQASKYYPPLRQGPGLPSEVSDCACRDDLPSAIVNSPPLMVEDGRGSGPEEIGGRLSSGDNSPRATIASGITGPPTTGWAASLQDSSSHVLITNEELDRLLQCPNCSGPINQPCTLPCGHSGCKSCLQTQHLSETVFLRPPPATTCRCLQCGVKHTGMDYEVDVALNKVVCTLLAEIQGQPRYHHQPPSRRHSRNPSGSVTHKTPSDAPDVEAMEKLGLDQAPPHGQDLHDNYQQLVEKDLDCEICYGLLLDPVTTPCGHSFCRRCLVRVLDHTEVCPICRQAVVIEASAINRPANFRLQSLIEALLSDKLTERSAAVRLEETGVPDGFDIPLFVCMLSYPAMPTFLFIFEPRYRLMMRRIMDGDRIFGMVTGTSRVRAISPTDTTNPSGAAAAAAGFCEYGTALRIEHMELMPDGTSVIQTRGVYRFRIRDFDNQDGYLVGKIDPVTDVSPAEEQALESADMLEAQRQYEQLSPEQQRSIHERGVVSDNAEGFSPMNLLSNEELVRLGHDFVTRMRVRGSTAFLNLPRDVLEAFGPPPHDADTFPYWFAAVVNQSIPERDRYRLLSETTRRQRLLLTSRWINDLDRRAAAAGSSCRVF